MAVWPDWWFWDLELSPHLLKRMADRDFTEMDLRLMLEDASGYHRNHEPGRWVVETTFNGASWEIIVEPDDSLHALVIVTAYPVGKA